MNKKGEGVFIAVVAAVFIFMAGILFMNFIIPEVTDARSASNLDCTNSTISDGAKLTCLTIDLAVPYYIILIISAAGGLIISKFAR